MAISNIEKQQEKLQRLNERIKQEKKKVDQRLGHEVIKGANLDYGDLDQTTIKELASKIVAYLNGNNFEKSNTIEHNQSDEPTNNFNQQ